MIQIFVVCVIASLIGFFLFQTLPEEIIKEKIRKDASRNFTSPDEREKYIRSKTERVDKVYDAIGNWGTKIILLFMFGPLFCSQVFR